MTNRYACRNWKRHISQSENEAPNSNEASKFQVPTSREASNLNVIPITTAIHRRLAIGASRELGCWNLVLHSQVGRPPSKFIQPLKHWCLPFIWMLELGIWSFFRGFTHPVGQSPTDVWASGTKGLLVGIPFDFFGYWIRFWVRWFGCRGENKVAICVKF